MRLISKFLYFLSGKWFINHCLTITYKEKRNIAPSLTTVYDKNMVKIFEYWDE